MLCSNASGTTARYHAATAARRTCRSVHPLCSSESASSLLPLSRFSVRNSSSSHSAAIVTVGLARPMFASVGLARPSSDHMIGIEAECSNAWEKAVLQDAPPGWRRRRRCTC